MLPRSLWPVVVQINHIGRHIGPRHESTGYPGEESLPIHSHRIKNLVRVLFQLRRILREAVGEEGTVWIQRLAGGPNKLIAVPFPSTSYPKVRRRALPLTLRWLC